LANFNTLGQKKKPNTFFASVLCSLYYYRKVLYISNLLSQQILFIFL